jgi:multidrug efflux pump subunit AcrA (membrane-fusion protein)
MTQSSREGGLVKKIVAAIFILLTCVSGCFREEVSVSGKKWPAIPVEVIKAGRSSIKEAVSCVGDIKAQEEIFVYSKVSGNLIENKVKEGDKVKKDALIALVDRNEAGFKFEKAPVTSPIDGIIGRVYLDRGDYVVPSSSMSSGTPAFLVVDMDKVEVQVSVVEGDVPKIREGQAAEVSVDAYPGEVYDGVVETVSPVMDIASRTAPVKVKVPNPNHCLKPGMFARVKIITGVRENVLVVPVRAIIYREGKEMLFVVEGSSAGLREVKIGLRDSNSVEVISGLEEGEEVIVEGCYGLKNGARVKAN